MKYYEIQYDEICDRSTVTIWRNEIKLINNWYIADESLPVEEVDKWHDAIKIKFIL
jgi:hypothetical protein